MSDELTREQVVYNLESLVRRAGDGKYADAIRHHDADLRAQLAAMERERDRLVGEKKYIAGRLTEQWNAENEIAELKQQLATALQELADEKFAHKKLSEQWNRTDLDLTDARAAVERLEKELSTAKSNANVLAQWMVEQGDSLCAQRERAEQAQARVRVLEEVNATNAEQFIQHQKNESELRQQLATARAAVVELADMVIKVENDMHFERADTKEDCPTYKRALALKAQAQPSREGEKGATQGGPSE